MILQTPNVIKIANLAQTRMNTTFRGLLEGHFYDIFSIYIVNVRFIVDFSIFKRYKIDYLKI